VSEPTPSTAGPVSVVVTSSVKMGREKDFEAWLKGTIEALTQYPGYQGANIVRPDAHSSHEYVFIARWDSYKNALAWEKSPERRSGVLVYSAGRRHRRAAPPEDGHGNAAGDVAAEQPDRLI
jgi:antibiotic biosynthesis monooxygenase (ABM) superfamily enzyme